MKRLSVILKILLCFSCGIGIVLMTTIGESQVNTDEFSSRDYNSRFGFLGATKTAEFPLNRRFSQLGIEWDRPHPGPFIWDKIEPQQGSYDFSKTDRHVKNAQKHGINTLATIWPYAEWDQEYWKQQPNWQPSEVLKMNCQ